MSPTERLRELVGNEPVVVVAVVATIVQQALLTLFNNDLVTWESIAPAVTLLAAVVARLKVTPTHKVKGSDPGQEPWVGGRHDSALWRDGV